MAFNDVSSQLGIDTPVYDPVELVNTGISIVLVAAGLLSLVYIFVGGFKFIVSGSNKDKQGEAIDTIRYAVLGLVVTILAFSAVTIVGRFFGLDLVGYVDFEEIFRTVNSWTSGASSAGVITLD